MFVYADCCCTVAPAQTVSLFPGQQKNAENLVFAVMKNSVYLAIFLYERGWRDSSVSIVTSLRAAQFVAIPAGERYFYLLQNVQTDSGAAAASCLMCTGLLLRR